VALIGTRPRMAPLAIAVAALVAGCGEAGDGAAAPDRAEVVELGATTVRTGAAAWGVAADGSRVWISDPSAAAVAVLDDEGGVQETVPTGAADRRDTGLAVSPGRLWVANLGGTVGVLDRASGDALGRVDVAPGESAAVAVAGGSAWVPLHGPGGGVARIDVETLEVTARVELPESAFAVAVLGSAVWVAGLDRRVFELDADDATVTRSWEVGAAPRGIAVTPDAVWVTLRDDREVVRIDPGTGEIVARIPVGGQPWPVATGAGSVWVAELEGRLLRIDPASNEVTGRAPVGAQPRGVAVGPSAVWVASQTGIVTRVPLGGR